MDIYSNSIFAKILANENINVVVSAKARTAAFDLENRQLILPEWEGVGEDLLKLLIAHEVSHAINTPYEGWRDAILLKPEKDKLYFKHIMNVIEDVRIERLIILKYPGLKKNFFLGYKELRDSRDFFGDFRNHPKFIDRLNCHLKLNVTGGNSEPILFDSKEQHYVDRAIDCDTFDEVVILANEILEEFPLDDADDFPDLGSGFSKSLEVEEGEGNPCECEVPENVEEEIKKNTFVITKTDKRLFVKKYYNRSKNEYELPDSSKAIFMRNCFNRRKRAKSLKERQNRETGLLDMNKLYEYKIKDNIFMNESIKNLKKTNHGLIVLVDGSSSMYKTMPHVAVKVYELYKFCKLEKIAFSCYVFSNREDSGGYSMPNIRGTKGGYWLYEFFANNNRVLEDFSAMSDCADGSTPLSSSLVGMMSVIEDFKAEKKIDKLGLVVITDGMCDDSGIVYQNYKHQNNKILIRPEKSAYNVKDSTAALYKIIRDIYDCRVITFNIANSDTFFRKNFGGADLHCQFGMNDVRGTDNQILKTFIEIIS